jgi:hypothetical protein
MTYLIHGSNTRTGLRGLSGGLDFGLWGGTGNKDDPYGGPGGANKDKLIELVKDGVTFKASPHGTAVIQTELLPAFMGGGAKFVYVLGSNGFYYKFKQTGTGGGHTATDDQTRTWFDNTVKANTQAVATALPTNQFGMTLFGGGLKPLPGIPGSGQASAAGGGLMFDAPKDNTMTYVGVGAAILGALYLMNRR